MLSHPSSTSRRQSSSLSTSSSPAVRNSHSNTTKRYHPYADTRPCRFPDDSASPSPPPAKLSDNYGGYFTETPTLRVDYFSALPQELIEEIGLLTCTAPFADDLSLSSSDPFLGDRHRIRNLHALSLVSKQFYQIFNRLLYLEPLVVDTQNARSLRQQNSVITWLNFSCFEKAQLAKRFTLLRPRSEEMKSGGYLYSLNPFMMLIMLTNVRELTFSGNFRNILPQGLQPECGASTERQWIEKTLTPNFVPHLSSVRLIDVDDAELVNSLLLGVAHNIKSLVIHPAVTGISDVYSARSVFTALRPTIENLGALESLTVSYPASRMSINHCNLGHRLIQKTFGGLPDKKKLKFFSLTLPLFDCRSIQLNESDSEEELDPKPVDHAWFWTTLHNFLIECPNLTTFSFKGSPIPLEIERRFRSCLNTTMSFSRAERLPIDDTTGPQEIRLPTFPIVYQSPLTQAPPAPPTALFPFNQHAPPMFPVVRPPVAPSWRTIPEPYVEPLQSGPINFSPLDSIPEHSIFDFQLPSPSISSFNNLPPIQEYFQYTTDPGQEAQGVWAESEEDNTTLVTGLIDPGYHNSLPSNVQHSQESSSFYPQDSAPPASQSQEWDWFIQYDNHTTDFL